VLGQGALAPITIAEALHILQIDDCPIATAIT
jgi:hypothetical protein